MRLIDADELTEWLKNVTITDGIEFETGFKQILLDIKNQPTAYDLKEVINQIHEYFKKVINDSKSDSISLEVLTYNKDICEIIRMGGVNNDIG